MAESGPYEDDFDPTHPSVWLIPTPGKQALVLAGLAKLPPIHHLWLERRFSTDEPDRSLAFWSLFPVLLLVVGGGVTGPGAVAAIVGAAVAATVVIAAPEPWTNFLRRRIRRDHGLVDPPTWHTRFASEDFPLVRLAEIVVVVLALRTLVA